MNTIAHSTAPADLIDYEAAERAWRRCSQAALSAEDLADEIAYWLGQRALLQGDLSARDFTDADEAQLVNGIAYTTARLTELTRQAERHARAVRVPGYPAARSHGDLTARFKAAEYVDLVGLIETLTGQQAIKTGHRYKVTCPFHPGDREPSLTIYEPGRGWHCFGCGKGGDAVTFVAELHHCTAVEALVMVEEIADTCPEVWQAAS